MNRESDREDPLVRGSAEHYDDAVYYDHTYRRRQEDVEFYRRLARQHGGPVLELGGGSGRVAIPLVRDGHEVTLLDASDAMLARARARAKEELTVAERKRLRIVRGDLRSFALRRKFGLVIAPFNVLLHLYEPDDFERCFTRVRAHLKRGAQFAFDVRVPQLVELARNPDKLYQGRPFIHPALGYQVTYAESFQYDPVKQVQFVTMVFKPGEGAPRGAKGFSVLLTHRQVFPNELRALLRLGGLRLSARYGDFELHPFSLEAAQQIVLAKAG